MTAGPFTECLLCAKHYSSIHAAPKLTSREQSTENVNAPDGEPTAPPGLAG